MTDIPASIRDRLADIMADEDPAHPPGRAPFAWHHIALNRLFAELQEPGEGTINAMRRGYSIDEHPRVAMRDAFINGVAYIRNGGI